MIQGSRLWKRLACSFCTRLIDSTPPATTMGTSSTMTLFAAVAIAIIPEEHWRSILIPAVVTGNPAAIAHWRAILDPCVPCWRAAPMMTSSTSPGSTPARSRTARMTGATMLGASRLLNEPRYDLVNPVRAVDTITASFIVVLLRCDGQGTRSLRLDIVRRIATGIVRVNPLGPKTVGWIPCWRYCPPTAASTNGHR